MILGIVEGLTEFLPVSSTGHLIVAHRLLGHDAATIELYAIPIQFGAISAIAVLYFRRLWRSVMDLTKRSDSLLIAMLVAALPAALLGIALGDWLDSQFTVKTVATTTLLGGVLLWGLEWWLRTRPPAGTTVSLRQALGIGLFQCLALLPGTSRSGSTIAGGLCMGLSRATAAEFSFFVGLPVLYGACGMKLWKHREILHGPQLTSLAVATLAAFISAILVVGPFVRFLQRHTFVPFAIYRIVAGLALWVLILLRVL